MVTHDWTIDLCTIWCNFNRDLLGELCPKVTVEVRKNFHLLKQKQKTLIKPSIERWNKMKWNWVICRYLLTIETWKNNINECAPTCALCQLKSYFNPLIIFITFSACAPSSYLLNIIPLTELKRRKKETSQNESKTTETKYKIKVKTDTFSLAKDKK